MGCREALGEAEPKHDTWRSPQRGYAAAPTSIGLDDEVNGNGGLGDFLSALKASDEFDY